jgi:hypothetical protein
MDQGTIRVLGPDEDQRVELQLGELALHSEGARSRAIRVIRDPDHPDFVVTFEDKDGVERARWEEPVAATEIFERLGAGWKNPAAPDAAQDTARMRHPN